MSQLICSKKIHFYFLFYTFYSENVKKSQKVVFCQIFRSTWFRSLCSDQITRSDHWLEKSDLDQIKSDLDHWSDLKKIRSTMLWCCCKCLQDLEYILQDLFQFFKGPLSKVPTVDCGAKCQWNIKTSLIWRSMHIFKKWFHTLVQ